MSDLSEILPPFEDFKKTVNNFNFSDDEIKLQSETVVKIGYYSLYHYLQIQYYYYKNGVDWQKILDEMAIDFKKNQELSLNFYLTLEKYFNTELSEELRPIYNNIKKLPPELKELVINFELKLLTLFINLILEIFREDKVATKLIQNISKDLETQVNYIDKNKSQKQIPVSEYIESLNLPNTNVFIKKLLTPNYYFPEKSHLLKDLYTKMLSLKCIKPNDDFEATFELEYKKPNINSTTWLLDTPKLLYFLYKLNDNKIHFGKKRIDEVAFQLFDFEKGKTIVNIQTTLTSISSKFTNEDYREKKLKNIDTLFT